MIPCVTDITIIVRPYTGFKDMRFFQPMNKVEESHSYSHMTAHVHPPHKMNFATPT